MGCVSFLKVCNILNGAAALDVMEQHSHQQLQEERLKLRLIIVRILEKVQLVVGDSLPRSGSWCWVSL